MDSKIADLEKMSMFYLSLFASFRFDPLPFLLFAHPSFFFWLSSFAVIASELHVSKASFEIKFKSLLWFITSGIQFLMVAWFRRAPVFYLPMGWFGPAEIVLSLPFAERGM